MAEAKFKHVEDRAVDKCIAIQEGCGLDVIADGEMRRNVFASQLAEAADGFGPVENNTVDWFTMEGKIESLTAQGKLQGVVMTGLPILLGVLLNFLEPEAMEKLWTTPVGWIVLAIVVFMLGLGYFMISKITSIDV